MTTPQAASKPGASAQSKRKTEKKIKDRLEESHLAIEAIKPDPIESARAAGLRYVSDDAPGIRRRPSGKGFSYADADGHAIRDRATLQRIKALAMPPAYREVWICGLDNGHIQATGLDERGRKQYRYHERWRAVRDEAKFARTIAFGAALPLIRERAEADLKKPGMPRDKVLAGLVQLLEKTAIRVGNEQYVRENKSYGLTTMRNRHVDVEGAEVHFHFKGKSGKFHAIDLRDRRLARLVTKLQELPGQSLFQYLGEDGSPQSITSDDVNAYLHEVTGQPFTAKDFRTWTGTLLTAAALQGCEVFASQAQAKRNVSEAIKSVARTLGNTPSICRKSYVHPAVLDAYMDGSLMEALQHSGELPEVLRKLRPEEAAVMSLLQKKMSQG